MDDRDHERVFSIEHDSSSSEAAQGSSCSLSRRQRFQEAWSACEPIIQDVLFSQNARILDQAANFLLTASIPERSQFLSFSTTQPIPTAVVLGGSPTTLSGLIDAWPEDRPTPLLARLTARDATSLRSTLRTLITRLIASGQTIYTPHVGTSDAVKGKRPSMLSDDNFELFRAWYETHASQDVRPEIVVALQDFEGFDPAILEDLVLILSRYRAILPIVLLLGVQTSVDAVNVLPYALKPLLRIQTFALQSGETTLTELFQAVLVSQTMPLSITAKVFQCIRDQFNDTDGSLLTVVAKLRYAYLVHFETIPVSQFTLNNNFDHESDQLQLLSMLPSFRTAVENAAHPDSSNSHQDLLADACEGNSEAFLRLLDASRSARSQFEQDRRVALTAYDVLGLIFKDSRQKDTSRRVDQLLDVLAGDLMGKCDKVIKVFRKATTQTFDTTLKYLLNALEQEAESPSSLLERLMTSMNEFNILHQVFKSEREKGAHNRQEMSNTRQLEGLGHGGRSGSSALSKPTIWDEQYTQLVQNVADELQDLFTQGFQSPQNLLFHELWYFDAADQIQEAFHPDMLGGTETALQLKDSFDSFWISQAIYADLASSDLSTAHRLFQDAGKLVNLGDWYQSFVGARPFEVELRPPAPRKQAKKRGRKRKDPGSGRDSAPGKATEDQESERKARFLRSVSELAWLGFIHGTKRKPEHVAKVIF